MTEPELIARVFPRKTTATPTDALAFYDEPGLFLDGITKVHVSVTFTYDIPRGEYLADSWSRLGIPVTLSGPAFGIRGEEFTPGMYLKRGYVITSRGCPNKCWFCSVWKRDGELRELPITEGWNVLDDNLLACSDEHIKDVFAMLKRQRHAAEFTGGLEAARLKRWHVEELANLKPKQMFFAYDTPDDLEPLIEAGKMLKEAGFTYEGHKLRCYVLMGHPKDSMSEAEKRLNQTIAAGFMPTAMLYRSLDGRRDREWARFQREWFRPHIVGLRM